MLVDPCAYIGSDSRIQKGQSCGTASSVLIFLILSMMCNRDSKYDIDSTRPSIQDSIPIQKENLHAN